jgi:hypothetical protein
MTPMLLVLALAAGVFTDDPTRPRIRALDPSTQLLLDRARVASPTVAALVTALEQRDVVVYLRPALGARGQLTFLSYGEPLTYVQIRIDVRQREPQRIATLAHELTHALEVAEACPAVRSEADLAALYRVIGRAGSRHGDFESIRASENEGRARRELAHATATRRPSQARGSAIRE